MENKNVIAGIVLCFTFIVLAFSALIYISLNKHEKKSLIVDLPEEISQAASNDTLIGLIRHDTLFIKFNK